MSMYVRTYMYVCTYMYVRMYFIVCMYVHMYVCTMNICTFVFMYVFVCVSMYLCIKRRFLVPILLSQFVLIISIVINVFDTI